ncbi:NU4M oxidoreductase, partial [Pseudoatta argentina]
VYIILYGITVKFRLVIIVIRGYDFIFWRFLMIYIAFFLPKAHIEAPVYESIIVIIISHGLRSSGIFYVVNLYYERSRRRLLFLNKDIISNLPTVIIL